MKGFISTVGRLLILVIAMTLITILVMKLVPAFGDLVESALHGIMSEIKSSLGWWNPLSWMLPG